MSHRHATMYFEDDPVSGLIDFRCDFFGPIDKTSHSHNIACQLITHMNRLADEQKNVKVDTAPTDEIQNGHNLIQQPLPKKVY
jgi:hypothetical protein